MPHQPAHLASTRSGPHRLSLVRSLHLADFFTLGNAACGMGSVLLTLAYMADPSRALFYAAAALAPVALLLDVLDGRIARARNEHSGMGRELDSLSDIVSFGVAPAALGFAAGLQGGWDAVLLLYFVCCGIGRLARYNVTAEQLSEQGKVKYFEGTPIPTSLVLTALLTVCLFNERIGDQLYGGSVQVAGWTLHPLALLYALSGSLMVSKTLRIPKW